MLAARFQFREQLSSSEVPGANRIKEIIKMNEKLKKIQSIADKYFSQNGKVRVDVQLNPTKELLFVIIENNFHTIIMFTHIEKFLQEINKLFLMYNWKTTIIERNQNTGNDTVLRIIVKDFNQTPI